MHLIRSLASNIILPAPILVGFITKQHETIQFQPLFYNWGNGNAKFWKTVSQRSWCQGSGLKSFSHCIFLQFPPPPPHPSSLLSHIWLSADSEVPSPLAPQTGGAQTPRPPFPQLTARPLTLMKGAHITKQLLFILNCSGSLFLQTQDTQHLSYYFRKPTNSRVHYWVGNFQEGT